jgi:hypothetical protein
LDSRTIMPFGKYKGKPLHHIPVPYLLWVAQQVQSPTLKQAILDTAGYKTIRQHGRPDKHGILRTV